MLLEIKFDSTPINVIFETFKSLIESFLYKNPHASILEIGTYISTFLKAENKEKDATQLLLINRFILNYLIGRLNLKGF